MNKGIEKQKQTRKTENEEKKEYLLSYKKYKQQAKRLEEQLQEDRIGQMFSKHMLSDMPKAKNKKIAAYDFNFVCGNKSYYHMVFNSSFKSSINSSAEIIGTLLLA